MNEVTEDAAAMAEDFDDAFGGDLDYGKETPKEAKPDPISDPEPVKETPVEDVPVAAAEPKSLVSL